MVLAYVVAVSIERVVHARGSEPTSERLLLSASRCVKIGGAEIGVLVDVTAQ
jgi:hypothetical protein